MIDGTTVRQKVLDMQVVGGMLYLTCLPVSETERSAQRAVTVSATKTLLYPLSRILRGTITSNEVKVEPK